MLHHDMTRWFPILPALGMLSCPAAGPTPADLAGGPADLEVTGEATDTLESDDGAPPRRELGPLYAARVVDPEWLLDGPGAYGRVGKSWVIGNTKARFVIQDVGTSVGVSLYGGNLIDMDLVRPPGTLGREAFRETFTISGWRLLDPDAITVVSDGSDGKAAILRVTGKLALSKILDLLDGLADDTPLEVAVEYHVTPDTPAVLVRTIIRNLGQEPVTSMLGDFLAFGRLLELHAPEVGFATDSKIGTVGLIAGRGDGVSYGYARPEGSVEAPFVDASGTAGILDWGLTLEAGETRSIDRLFVVGDGSLQSVIEPLWVLRGTPFGVLEGVVRGELGVEVAGVLVSGLPLSEGVGTHVENQAQTGPDGQYRLALGGGSYEVVVSGGDRLRSVPVEAEVDAGATVPLDLVVGPTAEIKVGFTGDGPIPEGSHFPVKLSLLALGGEAPDARLGEVAIHGQTQLVFAGPGRATFRTKPGHYQVVVSHGPEYQRQVLEDILLEDGVTLQGHLPRVVDTSGWVGCDFHQHTIGSLDANARLDDKLRENLTAGLECAALTDHDNLVDLRPTVEELGAGPAFFAVVGSELSVNGYGHFNAFPLPLDPLDPDALGGSKLWAGRSIDELFAVLRALPGERSILINHPRANGIKGYFTSQGYVAWSDQATSGTLARDFDGIEVNSQIGSGASFTPAGWAVWASGPSESTPVLADWFAFLNRGEAVCALGNSDSHDTGDDAGYPRTYLRVGTDDPAQITDAAIVSAIAAQHAVVAQGAFLRVWVDGQEPMGHTQLVLGAQGVSFRVVGSAPRWLVLDHLEVYANGLLLTEMALEPPVGEGTVWADQSFDFSPLVDTWYVFLVRGPEMGKPVFGGDTFAFTNPIYVDVDGGGFLPPGPVPLPTQ
jgi:hypothetical protein